jgi:hypothetical protein
MLLSRRTLIHFSLAAGLVAALAGVGEIAKWDAGIGFMDSAGWRPIAWPFAADDHPAGRAWRGHELEVYVRPKLGYLAACDEEIAGDEQLERASDIHLLDSAHPLREGRRIRVTDLFGWTRVYDSRAKDGAVQQAQAIAVSYDCHLLVALVVGKAIDDEKVKTARRLLESNTVQVWINQQFGSR